MKLSAAKIDALHVTLSKKFEDYLSRSAVDRTARPLSIEPEGDAEAWRRAADEAEIHFSLTNSGHRELERTKGGGDQPVYLLPGFDDLHPGAWVGWHEEWKTSEKGGKRVFELIGVSLKFFWGMGRNRAKKSILRAEWDRVERRGGNAAQPHWHIDSALMVDFVVGPLSSPTLRLNGEGLEELPALESSLVEIGPTMGMQDLNVRSMHLGMGGWLNASADPARWQCPIVEPSSLVCWVEHTLAYATREFSRLTPGELLQ